MKFKVRRNYRTKGMELVATSGKGEELDYKTAEFLQGLSSQSFLPFRYQKKGAGYSFIYRAANCISLEALEKRRVGENQFEEIFASPLRLLKICEQKKLQLHRILFSPSHVFFHRESATLMFVYIPVKAYMSGTDFKSCLAYICQHMNYESSYQQSIAREIYSYAMTSPIVSSIDYEKILHDVGLLGEEESASASRGMTQHRSARAVPDNGGCGFSFMNEGANSAYIAANATQAICIVRKGTGESWELSPGVQVIGRAPECELPVRHSPKLSRRHATLILDGDELVLRDMGSSNGTWVRGMRLPKDRSVLLHKGDEFVVGGEEFKVR